MNELVLPLEAGAVFGRGLRIGGGEHPTTEPFFGNSGCEGFVEIGVAFSEGGLVRQLMKECLGQINFRIVDKGVQDRVAEPADGGVSFDDADVDVVTFFLQLLSVTARVFLVSL